METNTTSEAKPQRPLGVWILTVYAVIFRGLVPIVSAITLFAMSDEVMTPSRFLHWGLGIGITISATETWRGNNTARVALLILVTLETVATWISLTIDEWSRQVFLYHFGFRDVLHLFVFPVIYIWYFTHSKTLEYYKIS